MIKSLSFALGAMVLLSGCGSRPANQANASANATVASAETRTGANAPLSGDQALAAIKQRQDHMKALGGAAEKVGKTLQTSGPDLNVIKQSASQITALAPKLQSWFPNGTGPNAGKTRAKAEIWQKPEDFALKAHDFAQAANDFNAAAQSGDLGQIKASFGGLGKSCKACHDLYRAPEH